MEESSSSEQQSLLELIPFGDSIWIVDGPDVDFYGFPYPTRMVVVKLQEEEGGGSWTWSPVSYTKKLGDDIEKATGGPVKYMVSPNFIHHIFLNEWYQEYPQAKVYASPGLEQRKNIVPDSLKFAATLSDEPPPDTYGKDIDQVVFRGGIMEEVVFYHKLSETVIFCDLIQRFPQDKCCGWKGWLMKLDGLVGPEGSTPREWRLTFWMKGGLSKAREALSKVLDEWKPEQLIIAHGECAKSDATAIVRNSLSWMGL